MTRVLRQANRGKCGFLGRGRCGIRGGRSVPDQDTSPPFDGRVVDISGVAIGKALNGHRQGVDEIWDLWIPNVGSTGLSFARTLVDAAAAGNRLLVHAAPAELEVTVRGEDGTVIAAGPELKRGAPGPITFLVRDGKQIHLEDGWPSDDDLGRLVILPGGETGVLLRWWHAADHSQWRWQVEFANHV
jgi:hypothetical protein